MNTEAVSSSGMVQAPLNKAAEQVRTSKKTAEDAVQTEQVEKNQIRPEELLGKINALTEGGLYSVRFESDDDTKELIVKIVDPETEEVLRQIPPEELLGLTKRLNELSGNIVDIQK